MENKCAFLACLQFWENRFSQFRLLFTQYTQRSIWGVRWKRKENWWREGRVRSRIAQLARVHYTSTKRKCKMEKESNRKIYLPLNSSIESVINSNHMRSINSYTCHLTYSWARLSWAIKVARLSPLNLTQFECKWFKSVPKKKLRLIQFLFCGLFFFSSSILHVCEY